MVDDADLKFLEIHDLIVKRLRRRRSHRERLAQATGKRWQSQALMMKKRSFLSWLIHFYHSHYAKLQLYRPKGNSMAFRTSLERIGGWNGKGVTWGSRRLGVCGYPNPAQGHRSCRDVSMPTATAVQVFGSVVVISSGILLRERLGWWMLFEMSHRVLQVLE